MNQLGEVVDATGAGRIAPLHAFVGLASQAPSGMRWSEFATEEQKIAKFDDIFSFLGSVAGNSDSSLENVPILEMMNFGVSYPREICRRLMFPPSGDVEWIGLEAGTNIS